MAADSSPATGVVISFNNNKGYGFIKPDSPVSDNEHLFFHYTDIQSDGYRTLQQGQKVEYLVDLKNDKKQAVYVTALDDGSSNIQRRRVVDGMDCYNCRGVGHLARDCPSRKRDGCYNCGRLDHIARECTRGTSRGCFKCGNEGHLARDCSVDAGRVSRSGCYVCGEVGHIAKECTSDGRPVARGGRAGGYKSGGGGACYNCRKVGHFARDCPTASSERNCSLLLNVTFGSITCSWKIIAWWDFNKGALMIKQSKKDSFVHWYLQYLS